MQFKDRVVVSSQKDGVRVSPWMMNNFDKGRFLNLDNFEKWGQSIPSEDQGWSIPMDDK